MCDCQHCQERGPTWSTQFQKETLARWIASRPKLEDRRQHLAAIRKRSPKLAADLEEMVRVEFERKKVSDRQSR